MTDEKDEKKDTRMEAGIRRWGNRWQAKVYVGRDESGKKRYIYKTFARKKDAEKWRLDTLKEYRDTGAVLEPSTQPLGSYLAQWLETIKPAVRPTTWDAYQRMVRKHIAPHLGMVPLCKLTPARVQAFYNTLREEGVGSRVLQYVHATLHRAMEQAVKLDLIRQNPCHKVEKPAHRPKEMVALTPEQVSRFLETARQHRLAALWILACTTGMRRGEVCGLLWRDVDLDAGRLTVRQQLTEVSGHLVFQEPKTQAGKRTVPLLPAAVEALREWQARQQLEKVMAGPEWVETGLVFTTATGKPLRPNNLVKRDFRRLLEQAGLPQVRFHDLRHSVATALLAQGVHPKVAQALLGHSRASITMDVYSHVLPTLAEQAVEHLRSLLPKEEGR